MYVSENQRIYTQAVAKNSGAADSARDEEDEEDELQYVTGLLCSSWGDAPEVAALRDGTASHE